MPFGRRRNFKRKIFSFIARQRRKILSSLSFTSKAFFFLLGEIVSFIASDWYTANSFRSTKIMTLIMFNKGFSLHLTYSLLSSGFIWCRRQNNYICYILSFICSLFKYWIQGGRAQDPYFPISKNESLRQLSNATTQFQLFKINFIDKNCVNCWNFQSEEISRCLMFFTARYRNHLNNIDWKWGIKHIEIYSPSRKNVLRSFRDVSMEILATDKRFFLFSTLA